MKIARCLLWPAVSITTCLAAPTAQECALLNKFVSAAKVQTQATSFCRLFIPPKSTTQTAITTTTSTTAIPTPTLTITATVTVTPDTTTITMTQDLCQPTARKLVREAARDDISGQKLPSMERAPALPRADSPSLGLQGRTASSSVANIQILGTSKDKRPSIWRLFAADALIKACSCLGTPVTVTTTSTATAFVAAAQVTTTTTTTMKLPVPTVYTGETTQFQLVSSTDILYLQPGSTSWYHEANNPTISSPQNYYLYKIQGDSLRFSSTDCLGNSANWNNGMSCVPCTLDTNLHLQCNEPYYIDPNFRFVYTLSGSAAEGSTATEIVAIPYCPAV